VEGNAGIIVDEINIVIEICGSAGEGTISAGEIFSKHMSRLGFEILSFDSYPSEIRGFGKCVAHSRISNKAIMSPGKYTNILVALNDIHSISQLAFMHENGIVIYDSKPPSFHEEDKSIAGWIEPGIIAYGIPLYELAQKAAGNSRGRNMVALGAIAALFGIDDKGFKSSIEKRYAAKKRIVIDNNVNSFDQGFSWTKNNITKTDNLIFEKPKINKEDTDRLIISGNQAIAMGAIDSDLYLYAGYPITPATKIMEILGKELPKKGGIMLQTEDEISAIGNVIGAGFAGKRAMTATSGPGFCLMTELSGLAVMAEVPAVIVNSQRGGPSTGLPTKTEQSDLSLAIAGGSGDSQRIVLAPANIEECYKCTCLAFYLAEKFQTLVVILMDFYLSNSIKNIKQPEKPDKKMVYANIAPLPKELKDYKRFKVTSNGISPRSIPGMADGMFVATGLEHNEKGKPSYDGETHKIMLDKRSRKLSGVLKEVPQPKWIGSKKNIEIGILTWGSTSGAAYEAVQKAVKKGIRASFMGNMLISPFPVEHVKKFSDQCEILMVPELNYDGQFAGYISRYLERPVKRFNMVSGLPMLSEDIFDEICRIVG